MHLAQFTLSQALPTQAPGVFTGGANVIAVLILLAEFGMLRQALLRDHVRLYMAQSALIAVLAVIVAAARHIPDLYVLAALTVALKVIVIPLLLRRLLRETDPLGAPAGGAALTGVKFEKLLEQVPALKKAMSKGDDKEK